MSLRRTTAVPKNGNILQYLRTFILIYSMALLQVPSVNCQTYEGDFPISMLPFCINLPYDLRSGKEIKIMGSSFGLSASVDPWLDIILRPACSRNESALYLKMRFGSRTLVRNSFQNGNWGDEESEGPFPFSLGAQFSLVIEVQPGEYNVSGNGIPLWTFAHRLPYNDVFSLEATGKSTSISRVELINKANMYQPENSQIIYPVPLLSQPVYHASLPFWGYFPEGLQAGKSIRIQGNFPRRLERTSINLWADCCKDPVLLHLDLRFNFGAGTTAVRNTFQDGRWGLEERNGPFPFRIGQPFTMLIHVQPDSYNIEVDGVHCWTFKHRMPFTQVTAMTIEKGPMNIREIQYIDTAAEDEDGSKVPTLSTETLFEKTPTRSTAFTFTTTSKSTNPSLKASTPGEEASSPTAEETTPDPKVHTPAGEASIPSSEESSHGTRAHTPAEESSTRAALSRSSCASRIYHTAVYSILPVFLTWVLLLM